MMKAEAVFEAQAAIEVYVILYAVKDKSGGFINGSNEIKRYKSSMLFQVSSFTMVPSDVKEVLL